jgi:hypothetical protein
MIEAGCFRASSQDPALGTKRALAGAARARASVRGAAPPSRACLAVGPPPGSEIDIRIRLCEYFSLLERFVLRRGYKSGLAGLALALERMCIQDDPGAWGPGGIKLVSLSSLCAAS